MTKNCNKMKLSQKRKKDAIDYMALPGLKTKYRFPPHVSIKGNLIESMVSEYYAIEIEDMVGRKRDRDIVTARHVSMWLLRKYTVNSLKKIGLLFNRDHTSTIHAVKHIDELLETDDRLRDDVRYLEMRIQ